jgi:polyhydroxyalkanoate synthesis regulator phasin
MTAPGDPGTPSIQVTVDEMLADGKLTREELKRFEAEMLADGSLSVEERRAIDRLLGAIASGQVTLEG